MLRVSKVEEWLPRPRDAERSHASPRVRRDCVLIRPGAFLPAEPRLDRLAVPAELRRGGRGAGIAGAGDGAAVGPGVEGMKRRGS